MLRSSVTFAALFAGMLFVSMGTGQERDKPAAPAKPAAHFHHLHLNSLDPASAINFYTSKFDCEKASFLGLETGVWAQKSWLLFHKVKTPPPWEFTSTIWHFGWGAENMKETYQKQLDMKTKFQTPITQLFPNFYYAYVDGPDHALIELNTAPHHNFGHLHLVSADPIAAGEWYKKHFGAVEKSRTKTVRMIREFPIGPNMSLQMDNVNIIIFPIEYYKKAYPEQWKDRTEFEPTKGRVVDHVGVSVDNLESALATMKKEGVKITSPIHSDAGGRVKYAFIEGPDKIRIEVIEGHARKD